MRDYTPKSAEGVFFCCSHSADIVSVQQKYILFFSLQYMLLYSMFSIFTSFILAHQELSVYPILNTNGPHEFTAQTGFPVRGTVYQKLFMHQ